MKSNQINLHVGIAGAAALAVLVAFAFVLAFASPIQADAAERGSITFCSVMLDEEGDVVTDDDDLPDTTFTIPFSREASDDSDRREVADVEFETSDFRPNRVVLSGAVNDAECVEYDGLGFGTYEFGEVEVSDEGEWGETLYHVAVSRDAADSLRDFEEYGGGEIKLDDDDSNWTVTVLNTLDTTAGEDDEDEDDDRDSGDESNEMTGEDASETLPGTALVVWETENDSSSRVAYGTKAVTTARAEREGEDDEYGYEFLTPEINETGTTTHSVAVSGLAAGTYYMRPISEDGGEVSLGDELRVEIKGLTAGVDGRYIATRLGRGMENDSVEVMKLQVFLKAFGGYDVDMTGAFDEKTFEAVKRFQEKYGSEILAPWGYSQPTGNVYILTANKINELVSGQEIALTAEEEAEIAAFRTAGAGRPVAGPATGSTGAAGAGTGTAKPTTTVPTTTPGTRVGSTDGENATGTAPLDRGVMGNLAGAIFSLPDSGTELTRCIFNLVIILAIIYIITSILVSNDETPDMPRERIKTRKLMFFTAGTIIATAFALFFDMFCLVAPLLIALIILIVMLAMQKMRKNDAANPPMNPLIADQSKHS